MALEDTLILIKPDAVRKGVQGYIIDEILAEGFVIKDLYWTKASEAILREHYADVLGRVSQEIGKSIIDTMREGPLVAAIVEGEDAIKSVRLLGGEKTEPIKCPEGSFRYRWGFKDGKRDSYKAANENRAPYNVIHTSDSPESAAREIGIWFPDYKKA